MQGLTNEQIAQLCHEVNRAYCQILGDHSQKPWADAEEWQRQSAIKGIGVALAGATPEQQHDAWMADKAADGWVYGPEKKPELKQHPCMVPYSELPAEQRLKDALFVGIVRACV